MKKALFRVLLLILTLTLVIVPLVSCSQDNNDEAPSPTEKPNEEVTTTFKLDKELEMKIYFLNGTTALGASKLIVDAKADNTDMN